MDISEITDIKELKALMADEFMTREKGVQTQNQATANINAIHQRIIELSEEKDPKGK